MQMPHEIALAGVYMPPLLVASLFGLISASITAHYLNHYRLSKYFFYPPLVFLALFLIYTIFIGIFFIRI